MPKKKILLVACLLLGTIVSTVAQVNYSGVYGYSMKPAGNPPRDEPGPTGSLILLRMEPNKYRFWLDINRGWPSYNMGATDGTIELKNDTASFDGTFEGASTECIIHFSVHRNVVVLTSTSGEAACGFGGGVMADGTYGRLKQQPVINNKWLKEQYSQSPSAVITVNKAEVFKDENCLYPKAQYFVKGNTLLAIAETEKSVYTECIMPDGKFIYGWIKRSALRIVETE